MRERGFRTSGTLRMAGLLLLLVTALGAQAEPPSSRLPGRKPDSKEPWGAFLGKAAHMAMEKQYVLEHPSHVVFFDTIPLIDIMKRGMLGDPKRLSEFVGQLRPDITDTRALVLFEIKPDHESGRKEAREQAGRYLAALNEAVDPGKQLSGGTRFEGSLFIEFEDGGALWQLTWRTPEPGVTLYRWSYRRKQPHTTFKERASQKEEQIPQEELEKLGELAERAIWAAYERVELPEGFEGRVYLPVECR